MPTNRKKGYQSFAHTADAGLQVQGKTMARLFQNAGDGMLSLITKKETFLPKKKIKIKMEAEDWESLIVAWLSEILYYFAARKIGFGRIKIERIRPYSLAASAWGEKIDRARHPVFREIKAATYHNLKIKKTKSGCSTKIIFDL